MAMEKRGLAKLMEECGGLIQVAAKRCAYMRQEYHPDGSNQKNRMEEKISDVIASINFVIKEWSLDKNKINARVGKKLSLFNEWNAAIKQSKIPLTEYLCPNCVTPWKCNGPHIDQEDLPDE